MPSAMKFGQDNYGAVYELDMLRIELLNAGFDFKIQDNRVRINITETVRMLAYLRADNQWQTVFFIGEVSVPGPVGKRRDVIVACRRVTVDKVNVLAYRQPPAKENR